ncbi:MAG TPA: TrkH family potassium uptake protein [Gaiellaceae bacterium]|nr:TrkH family potassium uptake protein [Gaiellaceae bacterium]
MTTSVDRVKSRTYLGLDIPGALGLTGTLLAYLSLSSLVPLAFAIGYREPVLPFLAAGAIAGGVGLGLMRVGRRSPGPIGFREGYLVVSLTWLLAAAYASLPYLFSGEEQLARPVDALFEGMSGFTTTGATIVTDPESLDRSLLIWRQLSQWLGGMGIIVLALAVLPRLRIGGRQIFESELPGPEVDQLAERIRDTARRLWLLYIALTAVLFGLLALIGFSGLDERMGPFEALAHALTTMPLGGFSSEPRSLELFAPVTQWVVAAFMALAGLNFALLYVALVRRRPTILARDEEARLYGALLLLGSLVVFAELLHADLFEGEEALRQAVFQVTSLMTGTGYAITDYVTWPTLSVMAIVGVMFVGASAGSPTGSVKIVRHLLVGRLLRRELRQTIHPELVQPIRLNGKPVDERTLRAVLAFVLLYIGIFIVGAVLLAIDARVSNVELGMTEAIAAAAGTLGNVGPALGFAGPMGSYAPFSDFSKLVMAALMWIGRLEVLPVLVLFTRNYWRV